MTKTISCDFSMNSPAFFDGEKYLAFPQEKGLSKADKELIETLNKRDDITIIISELPMSFQFIQFVMAGLIKTYYTDGHETVNRQIIFEGFSFGSRASHRFSQLAGFNYILRFMADSLGFNILTDVPPTAIKKFATGAGGCDKASMVEEWLDNVSIPELNTYMKERKTKGVKKIMKPLDDMADAYHLWKYQDQI